MKGRIILYTGEGEGKTASAIGHAVRAAGHGQKVIILHFMKGREDVGEFNYLRELKNIEVHLCGSPKFLRGEENREEHLKKVGKGMELAGKILLEKRCDLLVLDEVLYALKFKLIDKEELLSLLEKRGETNIILTGREPGKEVRDISDIITEMEMVKHHYEDDRKTILGLDY
ncbi:MAG: cob(I)yrinic acid a,c-diamide adenosyltransferase [Candidatus Hydrothermarchaeales archaeon]